MCRAGQWWICSCVDLVNGGYVHVQWWICSCVELANAMVDMLRCSSGQCMLNGGFTCVQWWSMVDMLICSSG